MALRPLIDEWVCPECHGRPPELEGCGLDTDEGESDKSGSWFGGDVEPPCWCCGG